MVNGLMIFLLKLKKNEYRVIKPYWARILLDLPDSLRSKKMTYKLIDCCEELGDWWVYSIPSEVFEYYNVNGFKEYTHIMFSHGFSTDRRQMLVEFGGIDISTGVEAWGGLNLILSISI